PFQCTLAWSGEMNPTALGSVSGRQERKRYRSLLSFTRCASSKRFCVICCQQMESVWISRLRRNVVWGNILGKNWGNQRMPSQPLTLDKTVSRQTNDWGIIGKNSSERL